MKLHKISWCLMPVGAVAAICVATRVGAQLEPATLFGFTEAQARAQIEIERDFKANVSAQSITEFHRFLAAEPHVAGSPRDRQLAEWTSERFRAFGLEDVQVIEHEVLLPYPIDVSVEMTAPRRWRSSQREEPVPGDEYLSRTDLGIPHHAYSASGEVTAPVVYAGSGNPADYDWLTSQGIDVRGKIALVRYSVPYSYRGFKALTAQQRGLAGILIYSDPEDDGAGKGKVYPDGPWGPESHIQRGGIVYDFMVPGDPLTPGWASVPGARRIDRRDAVSLPSIISAPMSARDAREILRTLAGPVTPKTWQGGLGFPYRAGDDGTLVRLRVKMDDAVRAIWTVVGRIRGSEEPASEVIVGNHRDAWIFGGVDPSSGSAALMELARTLGALKARGARPRRTIVLASWDAEEFTLTSSTEWGEQFEQELRQRAVAYLNVDSAASGPSLSASAVPTLNRLIVESAQHVQDPNARIPIAAVWKEQQARERGALPTGSGSELINNRLGSGSDYTVFLNFLGIPIADLTFDGPYGVYHSAYDNHHWVARIGDPGFRYHVALVQLWGLAALRLANADVLPLDVTAYAVRLSEFAKEVAPAGAGGDRLSAAVRRLEEAAGRFDSDIRRALSQGDRALVSSINNRLMRFERALLDPSGIPGRPWYRHQIFAPKFTYAAELLPALAEARTSGSPEAIARAEMRVAAAIDRAAVVLSAGDAPIR
jgi:N-acetylated-alpha-linked acidic dipeptidase